MKSTSVLLKHKAPSYGAYGSAPRRSVPMVDRKFDPESGQVYSETEVRPSPNRYSDWIGEPKTPGLIKKPQPNERGARSLAHMARIKVVMLFRNLNSEHFATVPWSMAEKIWEQMVSMRAETLQAWSTLAAAYPGAEEFGRPEYRYLLEIKQPSLPLSEYFKGISCTDTSWLACLRVSPKRLSTPDLVAIHNINNLAVLDLSDGQVTIDNQISNFDERVMRSWADLARSGQAFQHLRVILFAWQEHLSDWVFKYTECFPSLCHVIVSDCPRMHQKNRSIWEPTSRAAGWEARYAKRSAKSLRPIIGNEDFYFGSISGCYYDSMELFSQLAHNRRPSLTQRLPLLEVWLGTPRQWSHIVEDFPSSRTVFYENIKTESWKAVEGSLTVSDREPAKRARDRVQGAPGAVSPPPKRNSQTRPAMRTSGKNITDLLQEFRT